MTFTAERDLQDYLIRGLQEQNIPYRVEPVFRDSSCRPDIVTDDAIIEIKLHLNRSQLYMAYGQATLYQKLAIQKGCLIPQVWIIGQRPERH